MDDLDTSLLRTFLTLTETRNFTRAAEKIGRSQSATSMQISKLEEILDCKLFDRDRRNVTITQDGEKLLGYARQILGLSDDLIGRFRQPDIEGEIRFGSPEDFATFYLPVILASFTQGHPRVALNVNCDLTLSLIKDFEKRKYDLIVVKQEPGKLYQNAQPLWQERLVWVGSADANQAVSFNVATKTQSPLPLVLSPSPCVYRLRATEALDQAGVAWKVAYTSPSIAGVVAAVKAGLGYATLPRKMVPSDLTPLERQQGWPKLKDTEICLLARDEGRPAVTALVEYIRQHIYFNQKF
ncbi:MAG: LysR substrate-binding domain-containing protein [Akkermansiaceae bacterium]